MKTKRIRVSLSNPALPDKSNIMRIFVSIAFCLLSSAIFCQINYAKESDYKDFMKTKTMIVLDNNPFSFYNETIKNTVKSLWEITPYEIITTKEFNIKKNNKSFSFLILTDAVMEQKGVSMQYKILNLIMGGKARSLNEMPDLGSVPLSNSDEEEDNYLYKVGGILQFMQFFVRYNLNNPNTDIFKLVKNIEGNIGNKEIWLLKNEVADEANSIEKIKKYYSGIVKFVATEEISDAIARKDPKVVFLHKIGSTDKSGICWKFLINAENGKPIYFDQHKIDNNNPDAFTLEDFKKIKK